MMGRIHGDLRVVAHGAFAVLAQSAPLGIGQQKLRARLLGEFLQERRALAPLFCSKAASRL
jgi:hypothetical protein